MVDSGRCTPIGSRPRVSRSYRRWLVSLRRCVLVSLLVLAALLALGGVSSAHQNRLKVVASGLDNPRGLDIGRFGAIYVAEAGRGGNGPCIELAEGPQCAGATGAITRIWHGKQRRVVTRLPSLAGPWTATGPATARHRPSTAATATCRSARQRSRAARDLGGLRHRFGGSSRSRSSATPVPWPTSPPSRPPRTPAGRSPTATRTRSPASATSDTSSMPGQQPPASQPNEANPARSRCFRRRRCPRHPVARAEDPDRRPSPTGVGTWP